MAAENDETVMFELGGEEYELPNILDLDIDEWIVVYEYCGLVLDDFAPLEDPEVEALRIERLKHPGFMKAMAHVGYQRANPKQTKATIKTLVGAAKMIPLLESMAGEEEADPEADPTLTTEQEKSSSKNSVASSESSSRASQQSSDTPEGQLAATGTAG